MPDLGRDDNSPATRSDVRRVHDRLDKLTDLIHDRFVTSADLDAVVRPLAERVKKLEGWQDWAMRIVLGAVALGLLGLILTGGTSK